MGTSSSGKGPRGQNPLIPSFLGGGGDGSGGGDGGNGDGNNPAGAPGQGGPPAPGPGGGGAGQGGSAPDGSRYRSARSSLNRFSASGGGDKASLGRAVGNYIRRSSGGSRGASQKMSISRAAGARLADILNRVATEGPREALRQLGLETLAGRSSEEIFAALAEVICPAGGTIDEAIAREAYVETMVSLQMRGDVDFNALTTAQVESILESFIAKSIDAKICSEIGSRSISIAQSAADAQTVQDQIQDFIEGAVHDAVVEMRDQGGLVFGEDVEAIVEGIYESAFEMLLTASDQLEEA